MTERTITDAELETRTSHHPPTPERVIAHEEIRRRGLEFMKFLRDVMPAGPEALRAIDAVDDAVKHANAAVARRWS